MWKAKLPGVIPFPVSTTIHSTYNFKGVAPRIKNYEVYI
jgi:hypothetical protein